MRGPPRLLALNGSIRGADGDCGQIFDDVLGPTCGMDVHRVDLATHAGTVDEMVALVRSVDAFFVATGTYWGSWGSPLQRFFEVITPLEATDAFVGKPAACVVTMDSVGGVDVGTRLLGVFAMLGCTIPPFPIVVLSRTGSAVQGRAGFDDVWQARDLEVTLHNLRTAVRRDGERYRAWPVERGRLPAGRWPTSGPLEIGLPGLSPRVDRGGTSASTRPRSSKRPGSRGRAHE